MNLKFWKQKKPNLIDLLKKELSVFSHEEKIDHLKTIIPMICPGINVSRNPPKRKGVIKAEK